MRSCLNNLFLLRSDTSSDLLICLNISSYHELQQKNDDISVNNQTLEEQIHFKDNEIEVCVCIFDRISVHLTEGIPVLKNNPDLRALVRNSSHLIRG